MKNCWICGVKFEANTAWQRYCSRKCQSENYRNIKGRIIDKGRYCRQCGTKFNLDRISGANKQHCSIECSIKSARESRSKFYKNKPEKYKEYHKRWHGKVGTDSNILRFYLRYPDAPKSCQSCGENRVLDIAHKPEYKRNGAWRSKSNTTLEKVWILCPTCHALLDRKGYSPKELKLE